MDQQSDAADPSSALPHPDASTIQLPIRSTSTQNVGPTVGFSDFSDALEEVEVIEPGLSARRHTEISLFNFKDESVDFVHCLLTEGDTLVFLDYPEAPGDSRPRINCNGIRLAPSQCFRVHSAYLLALKESKFAKWLGNAIYQARVKRRRKPTPEQLDGIKYFLDLTPPQEGDELVFQMMELSLTPGLIKWWSSTMMHECNPKLVGGHDDLCSCALPSPTGSQDLHDVANRAPSHAPDREKLYKCLSMPPSPDALLTLQARGEQEAYETPDYRRIPDYCPFRYCNAIIRLLMMIEDHSVSLDSAPRVWTMVKVSKLFDCPEIVRDRVAQWILFNPRFIEVLPEESLSIGFDLRLPQITQSSFRILVNELAIEEAADEKAQKRGRKTTVFGRRLGDPGDERSNIIQHAARAMIERVTAQFAELQNTDVLDFWEIREWKKLRALEHLLERLNIEDDGGAHLPALHAVRNFMEALPHRIAHKVKLVMESARQWTTGFNDIDRDRARYVEAFDFQNLFNILKDFNQAQHLLCPFVYRDLGERLQNGLFAGQRSMHPNSHGILLSQLMRDAEAELQLLVNRKPSLASKPQWSMVFSSFWSTSQGQWLPVVKSPLIGLIDLEKDVQLRARAVTDTWVRTAIDMRPQLNLTRHMLLTLTANEMKYLPLWAGGNDDGTGGVFEEFLPPAEMGPNGPGPAFHTGMTIPSGPPSLSGSLMDEISAMKIMGSTTAGSVDVHDSISTVYRPNQVIAAGSSVGAESFADGDSEFAVARFEVPADHQPIGQTVDMLVDSMDDDTADTISEGTEIAYVSDDYDFDDNDNDDGDSIMGDSNIQGDEADQMDDVRSEIDARSDASSLVLV